MSQSASMTDPVSPKSARPGLAPLHKWLASIWERRDLLYYLVKTDLKIIYKDKLLGFLWTLLDPLLMMLVYVLLVVVIFKAGGPQFPVLLFCVLLSWDWFTYAIAGSVRVISSKASLMQVVQFPKAVLPLGRVFVGLVNYGFGLIVLVPMLFIFEAQITWNVLWLPALIFVQFLFTVGLALIFSMVGVYFRDLENFLSFGLRIWFYLSPGLYSLQTTVPPNLRPFYLLNPFAALFESYKNVLVLGQRPNAYMLVAAVLSMVVFWIGCLLFRKYEPVFSKDA